MTNLTNPAATGGINFGEILDKTLGVYQAVSAARYERDAARFQNAGQVQQQALHQPQGTTMLEAFNIGNAVNPAGGVQGQQALNQSVGVRVHPLLLTGGAVLGGLLLWRALK